jgi:3-oxoacyl-ACP reductase-like protein
MHPRLFCLDILPGHEIETPGTTFWDKTALLTGVGKGFEVVKGPLSGGVHAVVTTSSYSRKLETVEYY